MGEATSSSESLESLAARGKDGDRDSVERLVAAIQHRVYGLAMRMLASPADAEDATQEILIKVVTHLGTFRQESAFTTWVHRIATNHLLNRKRSQQELLGLSFDTFAAMIDEGAAGGLPEPAPSAVLAEELRIACTQGMLLCLDREHRLAYLLGEILELPGEEGAAALEISPQAFRMRLSRARRELVAFMRRRCGVFDGANPCRCSIQVPYAIRRGMLDPGRLQLAVHPRRDALDKERDEVLGLLDAAAVIRTQPEYTCNDMVPLIRQLISRAQD